MNSVCGYRGSRRFSLLALAGLSALLHQLRDHARPSGLVAGSDSSSRVTVEILVEQDQVAPMGVRLKLLQIPEHRSAAFFISKEYTCHAARKFSRYFPQSHHLSRSGWKLNLKVVAKVVMELLERLDQQVVHRKPDGAAPVLISTEQPGRRLAGLVIHAVLHSVHMEGVGVAPMELRQGTDAVW